ncbi:MAG: class I SAM-dependent methyltransferase, partial [Gammaproteobacteria bacterium]|nr:class I SAM-dependent methyltransferase [Gammaproteobacteria bacterium]
MLPPLSRDERRQSEAVAQLIAAEIAAGAGWLSFERFMELALYAPGLGYYSA